MNFLNKNKVLLLIKNYPCLPEIMSLWWGYETNKVVIIGIHFEMADKKALHLIYQDN